MLQTHTPEDAPSSPFPKQSNGTPLPTVEEKDFEARLSQLRHRRVQLLNVTKDNFKIHLSGLKLRFGNSESRKRRICRKEIYQRRRSKVEAIFSAYYKAKDLILSGSKQSATVASA